MITFSDEDALIWQKKLTLSTSAYFIGHGAKSLAQYTRHEYLLDGFKRFIIYRSHDLIGEL